MECKEVMNIINIVEEKMSNGDIVNLTIRFKSDSQEKTNYVVIKNVKSIKYDYNRRINMIVFKINGETSIRFKYDIDLRKNIREITTHNEFFDNNRNIWKIEVTA